MEANFWPFVVILAEETWKWFAYWYLKNFVTQNSDCRIRFEIRVRQGFQRILRARVEPFGPGPTGFGPWIPGLYIIYKLPGLVGISILLKVSNNFCILIIFMKWPWHWDFQQYTIQILGQPFMVSVLKKFLTRRLENDQI